MRTTSPLRTTAALATLALAAVLPVTATPAVAAEDTTTINLVGITDLHGHIEATTNSKTGAVVDPGAVTLACEVAAYRKTDPSTLVVSAGDNIGGSAYTSSILQDQPTLDILNAIGLDASAVGNHEFDHGLDDLDGRVLDAANFPYLSANATSPQLDAEGDGDGTFVKDVNGVKVGFVGVITDELPTLISPTIYDQLSSTAPAIATANARATELKSSGKADVVVVLAHTDAAAAAVASQFNGDVDAVIGGHSHVTYPAAGTSEPSVVTSTDGQPIAIVQPDHFGWKLADIALEYDPDTKEVTVGHATNVDLQTADCSTDAYGVADIVAAAKEQADVKGNVPLASIGSDFLRGASRGTESTASILIAESFQAWGASSLPTTSNPVIGLMNAGGVRADYLYAANKEAGETKDGILTVGEAYTVQPFGNEMAYADVTGAQLKTLLAEQWQPGADRSVLTLGTSSNVSVLIDQDVADQLTAVQAKLASGALTADAAASTIDDLRSRVITSIAVDGKQVADTDTVRVVSNSFVMAGGDGYTVLKDPTIQSTYVNTGTLDRDVTGDYLKSFTTPVTASYVKHQVGVAVTPSTTQPRTATVRLSGLVYSADTEKAAGATQVRYRYTTTDGRTVVSEPVAIDTTTVADGPETGQATLDVVLPAAVASRACEGSTSSMISECAAVSIEATTADGTVVQTVPVSVSLEAAATDPGTPTPSPSTQPTAQPSTGPTAAPTSEPTAQPSASSTAAPTAQPTAWPTVQPTPGAGSNGFVEGFVCFLKHVIRHIGHWIGLLWPGL